MRRIGCLLVLSFLIGCMPPSDRGDVTDNERTGSLQIRGHHYVTYHITGYQLGMAHDPDCPKEH